MVVFNSYVRLPEGTFLHSTWFIMFFHDMWSTKVVCIMNIVISTIITIIIIITILILIMIILYIYVCVPDWWFGTFFIFPYIITYWEFHHPNWRTHIFQRGRSTTNQIYMAQHGMIDRPTGHGFEWRRLQMPIGFRWMDLENQNVERRYFFECFKWSNVSFSFDNCNNMFFFPYLKTTTIHYVIFIGEIP